MRGSVSGETIRLRPQQSKMMIDGMRKKFPKGEFTFQIEEKMHDLHREMYETMAYKLEWSRNWTFITCWHMNDIESAAMWKLYAQSSQAIAVQSTFNRLFNCLRPHVIPPHGEPRLGKVVYIDYNREVVPQNIHLSEFFHKRKSFEHEAELRGVIQELPLIPVEWNKDGSVNASEYDIEKPIVTGKKLPVNLNELIENVYVAPTSPTWFLDLVNSVLKKYGLDIKVFRSSLDEDPLY
jgi:hypothetical protein